jgi:hypothetical protein
MAAVRHQRRGLSLTSRSKLSYRTRIVELQIKSGQLVAPTPVGYACTGGGDKPFFVTFYPQTRFPCTPSRSTGGRNLRVTSSRNASAAGSAYSSCRRARHLGGAHFPPYIINVPEGPLNVGHIGKLPSWFHPGWSLCST